MNWGDAHSFNGAGIHRSNSFNSVFFSVGLCLFQPLDDKITASPPPSSISGVTES